MYKTDYGGGGGKNFPKIDYVICERPLSKYEALTFHDLILRMQDINFTKLKI